MGVTYAFVINVTDKPLRAKVTIAGVRNRVAWRYSEGVKVKVTKVRFKHGKRNDKLPAYGMFVYVVR
jgi:hypothetical protein